jgi:hypothetical protein
MNRTTAQLRSVQKYVGKTTKQVLRPTTPSGWKELETKQTGFGLPNDWPASHLLDMITIIGKPK